MSLFNITALFDPTPVLMPADDRCTILYLVEDLLMLLLMEGIVETPFRSLADPLSAVL